MKKQFETPKVVELGTLQQIVLQSPTPDKPFADVLGPHRSATPPDGS